MPPQPALLDYQSAFLLNKDNLLFKRRPFFKNNLIKFFILNKQFPIFFNLITFFTHLRHNEEYAIKSGH